MAENVRVRYAPSPTGEPHIGNMHSALFEWLYARRHGRPWRWLLMGASSLLTLPFQYLRRLATGEQGGVVMKVRGWTDALRGRPIPFEELGLR